MDDRLSILCFAASYATALVLEVARLYVGQRVRTTYTIGFASLGVVIHTLYLVHRATIEAPLSSWFDWYLMAAWVLGATYTYLALRHPKNAIGIFLLPLVLALTGVAVSIADRTPFAPNRAAAVWATTHGVLLLLGTVAVSIGFAAGVMYLVQAYRLKHKLPPSRGFSLPSLEWLQHLNARAIIVSVLTLGPGILAGVILNLVKHPAGEQSSVAWNDPTVITSLLTAAWLIAALLFEVFYKPARTGRKVAYLTVASFVFLVLMLLVTLVYDSGHASSNPAGPAARSLYARASVRGVPLRSAAPLGRASLACQPLLRASLVHPSLVRPSIAAFAWAVARGSAALSATEGGGK